MVSATRPALLSLLSKSKREETGQKITAMILYSVVSVQGREERALSMWYEKVRKEAREVLDLMVSMKEKDGDTLLFMFMILNM